MLLDLDVVLVEEECARKVHVQVSLTLTQKFCFSPEGRARAGFLAVLAATTGGCCVYGTVGKKHKRVKHMVERA